MDKPEYRILKKELVYTGFCSVENYTLQTRLFSGEWSAPYVREVVRRFNAVAALPYDPIRNQLVLIEQFRIGALWRKTGNPWLLELVAGVIDREEDSNKLIRREMQEEAGLEVLDLLPICHCLDSPGGSSEEVEIYCVRVDASKASQFCGLPEENEDIRVHIVSVAEAFAAVKNGTIANAIAIIAIQWLELNIAEVRKQWG